jgi:hypothetical protein
MAMKTCIMAVGHSTVAMKTYIRAVGHPTVAMKTYMMAVEHPTVAMKSFIVAVGHPTVAMKTCIRAVEHSTVAMKAFIRAVGHPTVVIRQKRSALRGHPSERRLRDVSCRPNGLRHAPAGYWWARRSNAILTEPTASHANCSKTRRLLITMALA